MSLVGREGLHAYVASKHAVAGVTRSMAAELGAAGYHVVFSDADVAWVGDPLGGAWDRSFDLQGLSDVRLSAARPNLTASLLPFREMSCRHGWRDYMMATWVGTVGNGITPYPCASSGLWSARATPPGRAVLLDAWSYFAARQAGEPVACDAWNAKSKDGQGGCRSAPVAEWEQRTFNLMLLRHSIGLGDEAAPLRQRLLPVRQFVDAEALTLLGAGANATLVAIHAGSAGGDEAKLALLGAHGLVRPGLAAHRRFVERAKKMEQED